MVGDVEEILKQMNARYRFFGSTQNGTVIKGSDIDVLVWVERSNEDTLRDLERNRGKKFIFVKTGS